MKTFTFNEQEGLTILELAKREYKVLELHHSHQGICTHCTRDASLHYWPNGTCTGQSLWASDQKKFSPSEKLVTKYDPIIEKLTKEG